MILNKYSEVKQGSSTTIGSYSTKKSSGSSSSSSSSNKSVGLDREIWGQDDDGGDLDGDLTCGGNIYIVDNYDESEDDEDDDIEGYSGASRKQEPIMPLSVADDLKDKFDNDEGGNCYVKRQLVVDKNTYSKEVYLDYPQVKEDNSNKVNLLDLLKMLMPVGSIIMHNGSITESELLKYGWAVCNGNNGTPDLRGKFIKGASADEAVNKTGGSNSRTLTTDNMPSHNHSATTVINVEVTNGNQTTPTDIADKYVPTLDVLQEHVFDNGGDSNYCLYTGYKQGDNGLTGVKVSDLLSYAGSASGSGSATTTIGNTGGGTAFDNQPSYYTLIYIMRIA